MLPRDYYATVEGYNNKQKKKAELLRLSVFASKGSWDGTISYPDWCSRFFPLWFDVIDEREVPMPTEDQMKKLVESHKKFQQNKKNKKKK